MRKSKPYWLTTTYELAKRAGTCSFCNDQIQDGTLKPGARVVVARSRLTVVRFCPECITDLFAQVDNTSL